MQKEGLGLHVLDLRSKSGVRHGEAVAIYAVHVTARAQTLAVEWVAEQIRDLAAPLVHAGVDKGHSVIVAGAGRDQIPLGAGVHHLAEHDGCESQHLPAGVHRLRHRCLAAGIEQATVGNHEIQRRESARAHWQIVKSVGIEIDRHMRSSDVREGVLRAVVLRRGAGEIEGDLLACLARGERCPHQRLGGAHGISEGDGAEDAVGPRGDTGARARL